MKKNLASRIDWRSILGILSLVALAATVISYLIYETRGSSMRVSGTAAIVLVAAYLASGGLGQLRFFRSRQFFRGSASTVYTVAVIGILIVVNALAGQANWRWDLTHEGMFTLSDQTVSILQDLRDDVHITAFFPEGSGITDEVESLLREYQYHSSHVHVNFVDPDREPALARQYEVTRPFTTIVESGGQTRAISGQNLYDFSGYTGNEPSDIQFRGEQTFTRTIMQLTQNIEANLYFITGHGEADLYGEYASLRTYIRGEGYQTKQWNPGRDGALPDDADVAVLAGPTRDLHPNEATNLRDFVDGGGKLMLLAGAAPGDESRFPNLDSLGEYLGIRMRPDAVADPARGYYMDAFSPVPRMDYHPVTEKLIEAELLTVLPLSRSMHAIEDYAGEYQSKRILFSSPEAWSETNLSAPNPANAEAQGVLAMGFAVTRPRDPEEEVPEGADPETEPVAVLLGSSAFLESDLFGFQGNSDLFVSSLQWLIDRPDLIAIGPKRPIPRQVFLSPDQGRMIFYGSTLGLPFAVLLIGAIVWLRRRNL